MHRNLAVWLLMVVAFVLVLSGCSSERPQPGGRLSLFLGPEPASIDPALAEDPSSVQVDELLFLGLTGIDDHTQQAVPELATRWDVSADGLTWKFYLRQDVHWVHYVQGRFVAKRVVTAHDVEYAVRRALTAQNALPGADLLYILRNARAFHDGKLSDPTALGVRAVGDYEIDFTLERPAADFAVLAGLPPFRPVPKEVIEQAGERWTEPGNVWTNGPFALASWEHGSALTVVRNPRYYDVRTVALQQVTLALGDDEDAAFALYREDKLDVCPVPADQVSQVRADGGLAPELHLVTEPGTEYYGFNGSEPPFTNPQVRRAFSLAIDRAKLVDTVLQGQGVPAKSLGAPGATDSPANDQSFQGVGFDLDQARKLLADAGYPAGKGLPPVLVAANDDPQVQAVAAFVQQAWQQELGAKVTVQSIPWTEYYDDVVTSSAPPAFRMPMTASYPSESAWLRDGMLAPTGALALQWRNTDFDRLLTEAARTADPARRQALYARAEQTLCVDDAALIPLYHPAHFVASKPWVERTYAPFGVEHIEQWQVKAH